MKKIALFLLAVSTVFLLIGCIEENPVEDTTDPTFAGISTVEISVGDTFDPLAGVSQPMTM